MHPISNSTRYWYLIFYHKNSEKYLGTPSKSVSKQDFQFWNYHFLLVLYSVCYDFDRDSEGVARYFSEFLWQNIKFPTFLDQNPPSNWNLWHVFFMSDLNYLLQFASTHPVICIWTPGAGSVHSQKCTLCKFWRIYWNFNLH